MSQREASTPEDNPAPSSFEPPRDPRHIYLDALAPPPDRRAYIQAAAQRGMAIALACEGVLTLCLLACGQGLVLTGLVDGLDELCGCVALVLAGLLMLLGYLIGSAVGDAHYRRALAEWQQRR